MKLSKLCMGYHANKVGMMNSGMAAEYVSRDFLLPRHFIKFQVKTS